MTHYVGLDVSLKETKLHVLDEAGNRVWRGRCATEPTAMTPTTIINEAENSCSSIGILQKTEPF
jgi:hypothetical protein